MKFTVNMLLTCSIQCDAGPGCLIKLHASISTVCRFLSRISYLSSYVMLLFGDTVALLRESYPFV